MFIRYDRYGISKFALWWLYPWQDRRGRWHWMIGLSLWHRTAKLFFGG